MDRRSFLTATSCIATASCTSADSLADSPAAQEEVGESTPRPWRVAVIGHTGRGNYGHGLDTVWLKLEETRLVGVADANRAGLEAAMKRLRVEAGYAEYRKMLDDVRPDIVSVCTRQPDQHRDMILAAIRSGAKAIYIEKPFCCTPAEADEIVAACAAENVKLAVAHRNRYHPALQAIEKLVADGGIGQVLEIRGRGKGDRRGGAEDLWVLGSHVLNLVHFFGGPAKSCSAVLRQDGRRVTAADVREGNEALGPIAGNQVHARYELENTRNGPTSNLIAYFDSIANDGTGGSGFGLQIIGSEGIIDVNCDQFPLAYLAPGNPFRPLDKPRPWIPISSAGVGQPEPLADLARTIGDHTVPARDLIATIGSDRQPLCSVHEGAMTVEMISAVFASHRAQSGAVSIPLSSRQNELAEL